MVNKKVYSLGHSNIKLEEFIEILKDLDIKNIMDIRSYPKSNHVPHFDRKELEKKLNENAISYTFCGKHIGGRQPIDFNQYANTNEYKDAIRNVERIINRGPSAIMCSENDFTKCHRRYICNSLIEDGFDVIQVDVRKKKVKNVQLSLGE